MFTFPGRRIWKKVGDELKGENMGSSPDLFSSEQFETAQVGNWRRLEEGS